MRVCIIRRRRKADMVDQTWTYNRTSTEFISWDAGEGHGHGGDADDCFHCLRLCFDGPDMRIMRSRLVAFLTPFRKNPKAEWAEYRSEGWSCRWQTRTRVKIFRLCRCSCIIIDVMSLPFEEAVLDPGTREPEDWFAEGRSQTTGTWMILSDFGSHNPNPG
jgi:hypothetical protein